MSRVILVTGSSRGIGAATALLAAQRGFSVCVNYRANAGAADRVVAQCHASGAKAFAVQADVANEEEVEQLFREVDAKFGRLDALVNNAGVLEAQMRVEAMDVARWSRVFAANVFGTFMCCREAVQRMSTKRGGTGGAIVNLSSVAARTGAPGEYVDYAASKAAIDALTIGLAREVAQEGIRVNAVRPGFIYTDIHASGGEPGRFERVKTFVPMGRGGHPDEIAPAILWLLSDEASYATGTIIDLAGGR